jgi:hypothetical protein
MDSVEEIVRVYRRIALKLSKVQNSFSSTEVQMLTIAWAIRNRKK